MTIVLRFLVFRARLPAFITHLSKGVFFHSGLHLEGPFISKEKKGAHKEVFIEALDPQGINKMNEHYGSLDSVRIITLAPEQPYSMETIKDLSKKGITVSIG